MSRQLKKDEQIYRIGMIAGGIILFLMALYFSIRLDMDCAPDERMRVLISTYIYQHHCLPLGNEQEVRNIVWGFSYGYTPYLPSLFGAFNMWIVSFFSTNDTALLTAARFENVCALMLMWFLVGKVGCRLFKNRISALLLAVMVCYLPQVVFIGSYQNNDMISLMCTAWITLGWLRGDQDGWDGKNAVFLGTGIGILALTYYNDYGWILCSIFFYFISAAKQKLGWKKIFLYALIVFAVAFAIAGWFFIRNYLIHNGDFLGMNTMYADGEKYAWDEYKPSNRQTPARQGLSLYETFVEKGWIRSTWKSFIGVFGFLQFEMKPWFYNVYRCLFIAMLVISLIELVRKRDMSVNLAVNFIICMIIPVVLSMYYSYRIDYQAQGRYIISILLPLMYFCGYGFDSLSVRIKNRTIRCTPGLCLTAFWLTLSFYCLHTGLVANCLL